MPLLISLGDGNDSVLGLHNIWRSKRNLKITGLPLFVGKPLTRYRFNLLDSASDDY